MGRKDYPVTPDGRYFVSRSRLWRCTDPMLDDTTRRAAIKALMRARRAVMTATGDAETTAARAAVDAAKHQLGERGPVWWTDGAPDQGGLHPGNSTYAAWWAALDADARTRGEAERR